MNSNLATGLTVASNMVGSVTLILPDLFHQNGLLSCLVVMVFMCVVYCKTCQLWVKHVLPHETDISQIVRRVLGQKWFVVLGVSSGLFLMLLCVIYFLLLNSILYKVIAYVLKTAGADPNSYHPDNKGIAFDRMSIQYLGIGLGCVFLPLFNLKSIDKVLVLARYGVIALVGYFLELLAMFITSVAQRGLDFGAVRLWAADADGWIKIAGQFSLAFISHNTIVAVTRDNKSQKEKPRAIAYGYAFAGVLYMLLGVFGGLAIQNYDYFEDGPFLITEGILIFIYISSIFGIFPYVSRSQFFCWKQGDLPTWMFILYNGLTWVLCILFQLINVSPGIVIAITGTGVGLFVCFVLPIYIHMKCYYPDFRERPETEEGAISVGNSLLGSEGSIEDMVSKDLEINKKPSLIGSEMANVKCVRHQAVQKVSFRQRVLIYGLLMLIGVGNFALQIKLLFQ